MPAYLTHRAAGEMVLSSLGDSTIADKKAFYLGCQGPDILFFRNYQPWKRAKKSLLLGFSMHQLKVKEFFENALEYVREYMGEDSRELISYMAGMITHYSIDKNAHPFVYKKAGKDSALHHRIEFMWDSFGAKELWDIEAEQYSFSSEIKYRELGAGICDWYCDVAQKVYNTYINPKVVLQAQKHFAKAKQSLNNLRLPGEILLKFAGRVLKFDTSTLKYPKVRDFSVFSKDEYKSMQKMIQKGVNEAVEMVSFAMDYIEGGEKGIIPEWFGDVDFSGNAVKIF